MYLHCNGKYIIVNEYIFNLEYIIFGSKTSQDYDILINIPLILTTLPYHNFLQICQYMDEMLSYFLVGKPINTSLASWKNGELLWCQKGAISEINNAILRTFNNHSQILLECPFKSSLNRSEKDIKTKIVTSCRMIMGIFTHVECDDDIIYDIINQMVKSKYIQMLDRVNLNRFYATIFKIHVLRKSVYKTIISTLSESDANIIKKYNQKLEQLRKQLKPDVEIYKRVYNKSYKIIVLIHKIVNTHISEFDPKFIEVMNDDLIGYRLSLAGVTRAILATKYIRFRIEFIKLINLNNIYISRKRSDKLKMMAFQMGQTMSLITGHEFYDKEEICTFYPSLRSALTRMDDVDVNDINIILHDYLQTIEKLIAEDDKDI